MTAVSPLRPRRGRSDIGPRHLRRQDVMRYFLRRALEETPLTLEDFTDRLSSAYEQAVVGHARRLPFTPLSTGVTHREYAVALGNMVKTVQRYLDTDHRMHFPCELEEAWVVALPLPYDDQCRRELARRHGYLGVEIPRGDSVSDDLVGVARVSAEHARSFEHISKLLADGHIGPEDGEFAGDAMRSLEDLGSAAYSLAQRIRVQTASKDSAA